MFSELLFIVNEIQQANKQSCRLFIGLLCFFPLITTVAILEKSRKSLKSTLQCSSGENIFQIDPDSLIFGAYLMQANDQL